MLVAALAYFLFSFHAVFTLEWIGEWNRFGGRVVFNILVEDITGFGGMVFRLSAGVFALAAVTYYLVKRGMPKPTALWITRMVVVLEAIYWLGLLTHVFPLELLNLDILRRRRCLEHLVCVVPWTQLGLMDVIITAGRFAVALRKQTSKRRKHRPIAFQFTRIRWLFC